MKSTEFHPADYDGHGRLRLPFLFWCVLLLQARTWVLFVIAGSSREQGNTLLNLFYPDHNAFWLGLLPGVPAVVAFTQRAAFCVSCFVALAARIADSRATGAALLATDDLAGRRSCQRHRTGAAGCGYRRAGLAVNQSTSARLFFP